MVEDLIFSKYFFAWFMFKYLYPSGPVLQMLTFKILFHDTKKRVTILYIFDIQENGYWFY